MRVTIPRHADYDSAALPTELTRQVENGAHNTITRRLCQCAFFKKAIFACALRRSDFGLPWIFLARETVLWSTWGGCRARGSDRGQRRTKSDAPIVPGWQSVREGLPTHAQASIRSSSPSRPLGPHRLRGLYQGARRAPSAFVVCNVTAPLTVDCGGVPAGNLKLPPPIRTGISLCPIRLWI